jgi:hypothetical protein
LPQQGIVAAVRAFCRDLGLRVANRALDQERLLLDDDLGGAAKSWYLMERDPRCLQKPEGLFK